MKICPKCGFQDHPLWRYSRFDYDAEYMEEEEFQTLPQYSEIWEALKDKKTFRPVEFGGYYYYRRGRSRRYIYRVLPLDFKMPRK